MSLPLFDYCCEYCSQGCSSFQAAVSHCVASHADKQVCVSHRLHVGGTHTPMRFEITPSQHLRGGQRIVCSLDRMALGIIGADDVAEDSAKPQCASLKLYLPLPPERDRSSDTVVPPSVVNTYPALPVIAPRPPPSTSVSVSVTMPSPAVKRAIGSMPLALKATTVTSTIATTQSTQDTASAESVTVSKAKRSKKNVKVKEELRTQRTTAFPDETSLSSLLLAQSQSASLNSETTVPNVAQLTIENSGWRSKISPHVVQKQVPATPGQILATKGQLTNLLPSQQVKSPLIPMLSNLLAAASRAKAKRTRHPASATPGMLTSRTKVVTFSSDKYCLVPVDTSTGRVVSYLPRLPLSSLQRPPFNTPGRTQYVPVQTAEVDSQLKIVDVASLAPGDDGTGIIPEEQDLGEIDGEQAPSSLQIGGVHFENTDLLSQAVVMRGGERSVSCITYSYDTLAHIVSPGLLISQRDTEQVPVSLQTSEVKTERLPQHRHKPEIKATFPQLDSGPLVSGSNYRIVPLYVSSQNLSRRTTSHDNDNDVASVERPTDVTVAAAAMATDDDMDTKDIMTDVTCTSHVLIDGDDTVEVDDAEPHDTNSDEMKDNDTPNSTDQDASAGNAVHQAASSDIVVEDSPAIDAHNTVTDDTVIKDDGNEMEATAEPNITDNSSVGGATTLATPAVEFEISVDASASDTVPVVDVLSDEGYSYGCFLCNFVSLKEIDVGRHWIEVHMPEKPYFCCYCCAVFGSSYKTLWHIRKFHSDRKLSVSVMPSHIYNNSLLFEMDDGEEGVADLPMLVETDTLGGSDFGGLETQAGETAQDGQFVCRKCNYVCRSTTAMKLHIRRQHLQYRPFSCVQCRATFTCSFDLKRHQASRHTNAGRREGRGLLCKVCNFSCPDMARFHHHMIDEHNFTASIRCPRCSFSVTLSEEERASMQVKCSGCANIVEIVKYDSRVFARGADLSYGKTRADSSGQVFICKICDYKTREKSGMTRHIKYNHTQCRPYKCAYCQYAAVERPKVRIHIASNHRGRPPIVRKCEKAANDFRNNIAMLFRKLTITLTDNDEMDLYEGDGATEVKGTQRALASEQRRTNTVKEMLKAQRESLGQTNEEDDTPEKLPPRVRRKRRFTSPSVSCDICSLTFMSETSCREHVDLVHGAPGDGASQEFSGEHFRCSVCGYRCHDRSCMARHIKYMHLTGRPHTCPYCDYANVEKTKVRLHVKAAHRLRPLSVKTDERLLVSLSSEVKKYYIKISDSGEKVSESYLSKYRGSSRALQEADNSPDCELDVLNMHGDDDATSSEGGNKEEVEKGAATPELNLEDYVKTEIGVAEWVKVKEEPCWDEMVVQVKEEPVEDREVDITGVERGRGEEGGIEWVIEALPDHSTTIDDATQVVDDTSVAAVDSDNESENEVVIIDKKLHRMKAVVVLQDIVDKILSS